MTKPVSGSSLAQKWCRRLQACLDAQHTDPNNLFAWRQQLEIRVLKFLLSRYSDDASILPSTGGTEMQFPLYIAATVALPNENIRTDPNQRLDKIKRISKANLHPATGISTMWGQMFGLDEESLQKANWKRIDREYKKRTRGYW